MAQAPERLKEALDTEILASGGVSSKGEQRDSGVVADLVHNLNRIKVWLFLSQNNEDAANLLLNREKVQQAAELLSSESGDHDSKTLILKTLGVYKAAEQLVTGQPMNKVLGVDAGKLNDGQKEAFNKLWNIDDGKGKTTSIKTVEEVLSQLARESTPDMLKIQEVKVRIETLKDRFGVEKLKFVNLNRASLAEIEDGVAVIEAKSQYFLSLESRDNSGGKTAVATLYGAEIGNEKGLLQVRAGGKRKDAIEKIVKRVRENAKKDVDLTTLETLTETDLIKRFEDVNDLFVNMRALTGINKIDYVEVKRIRLILTNLQIQYQEQLATKIADQWKKLNKPTSWQEVKYQAMEKALQKKRKWFSAKVVFDGKDEKEQVHNLASLVDNEARILAKKLEKSRPTTSASPDFDDHGEPSDKEWQKQKLWNQVDEELTNILGTPNKIGSSRYNPFEDKDFWKDLSEGDSGIKKIIDRATALGVKDKKKFEELIRGIGMIKDVSAEGGGGRRRSSGGMDDEITPPEILAELMMFMKMKEYGAAANAMLEYTTRVGMQENSNDLQFMYVRRMFMEQISHISPDFAEQFQKNQQMGYVPGLFAQKPEDFYATQGKIFNKSNLDLFFGSHAFMSGNVLKLPDGKEFVYSTKSFMTALRSERNILKILRADPNSMDSTLQGIMIEEMFGEGSKIELGDVDGKDVLYLRIPGKRRVKMSDVKVDVSFAEIDKSGFKGWRDPIKFPGEDGNLSSDNKLSLEDMLNRNQWMLRNGANFMWYSEIWMDTLKSYQPSIMGNAPKALLTAASAIADYKASFEIVTGPFLDLVQKLGDMLGPMERYKATDMVAKNVAKRLTNMMIGKGWSDNEEDRKKEQETNTKLGKIFEKIYVRKTKASLNGGEVEINNRIRSREMTRYAFNTFKEKDVAVAAIVRKRLIDLGMYEKDIPDTNQLLTFYEQWKAAFEGGNVLGGKSGYMGQEYAAVWEELKELQMSGEERTLWSSIDVSRFKVLREINDEVTGGFGPQLTKDTFWQNFNMEAFIDRTGTKHGDDWEQFAMKYAPAKVEALKLVYKIASLNGSAEDYVKLKEQLDLFMPPEDKRKFLLALMDRQSIATREEWLTPYEVPELADGAKSSNEVKWVEYTDSTGKQFFARTADGARAYHKRKFRGNYARQVLDKDWWRPHDFENLLLKWRGEGLMTKHEAHHMAEKLLGTRRAVDSIVDGFASRVGINPDRLSGFKNTLTKSTTAIKLLAVKLFIFDDPAYAFWTLFQEVSGFGGKAFEHIFGFSVGGGGGHH